MPACVYVCAVEQECMQEPEEGLGEAEEALRVQPSQVNATVFHGRAHIFLAFGTGYGKNTFCSE
jgi:hypothetical protein